MTGDETLAGLPEPWGDPVGMEPPAAFDAAGLRHMLTIYLRFDGGGRLIALSGFAAMDGAPAAFEAAMAADARGWRPGGASRFDWRPNFEEFQMPRACHVRIIIDGAEWRFMPARPDADDAILFLPAKARLRRSGGWEVKTGLKRNDIFYGFREGRLRIGADERPVLRGLCVKPVVVPEDRDAPYDRYAFNIHAAVRLAATTADFEWMPVIIDPDPPRSGGPPALEGFAVASADGPRSGGPPVLNA